MEIHITAGRQIVIIVGAGASCDHSKDKSSCPPLAKDLAKELRSTLPQFVEVEKRVGELCLEDFEKWMDSLKDPRDYTDTLWCLSKYFARFKEIPDDSLYLSLIQEMGSDLLQKTLFVSLNYEVLLEMGIRKKGYCAYAGTGNLDFFNYLQAVLPKGTLTPRPHELCHYCDKMNITLTSSYKIAVNKLQAIPSKIIPIIKPHGSCHYRVQMNVTAVGCDRMVVVDNTSDANLGAAASEDPLRIDEEMEDFRTSMPSVASAFNTEKSSSFNRKFIESSRNLLLTRMEHCKEMALIGVNFRPYDHFINKVVRTGLEAGASIGFLGDQEAFNNYRDLASVPGINHVYLGTTFRGGFTNLIKFLKA